MFVMSSVMSCLWDLCLSVHTCVCVCVCVCARVRVCVCVVFFFIIDTNYNAANYENGTFLCECDQHYNELIPNLGLRIFKTFD